MDLALGANGDMTIGISEKAIAGIVIGGPDIIVTGQRVERQRLHIVRHDAICDVTAAGIALYGHRGSSGEAGRYRSAKTNQITSILRHILAQAVEYSDYVGRSLGVASHGKLARRIYGHDDDCSQDGDDADDDEELDQGEAGLPRHAPLRGISGDPVAEQRVSVKKAFNPPPDYPVGATAQTGFARMESAQN